MLILLNDLMLHILKSKILIAAQAATASENGVSSSLNLFIANIITNPVECAVIINFRTAAKEFPFLFSYLSLNKI